MFWALQLQAANCVQTLAGSSWWALHPAVCAAAAVLKQVAKASRPRLKRHWSWSDGKGFLWDSEHRTNAPNCIIYLKLTPFCIQASRSASGFLSHESWVQIVWLTLFKVGADTLHWETSTVTFSIMNDCSSYLIAAMRIDTSMLTQKILSRPQIKESVSGTPASVNLAVDTASNRALVFLSFFCLAALFKVLMLGSLWCDITAWCELWYYYYSEGYFFCEIFFRFFFFRFPGFWQLASVGFWLLASVGFYPASSSFFLILASVASSAASTAEQ